MVNSFTLASRCLLFNFFVPPSNIHPHHHVLFRVALKTCMTCEYSPTVTKRKIASNKVANFSTTTRSAHYPVRTRIMQQLLKCEFGNVGLDFGPDCSLIFRETRGLHELFRRDVTDAKYRSRNLAARIFGKVCLNFLCLNSASWRRSRR